MPDTIEKRVLDLENLMSEIPEILNLRNERFENAMRENTSRFDEMGGRLNLLDRQMGMMVRDMRELRGAVTRQLIAQDERLAKIEGEVAGLKSDVAALKSEVASLKSDVSSLKSDVSTLKSDVADMKATLALILERLPKP